MATFKAFKPLSKSSSNLSQYDKLKCLPSFHEYLTLRGNQLIAGCWGEQNFTLYTVPIGHTFFLTSVSLATRSSGANGEQSVFIGTEDSEAIASVFLNAANTAGVSNKEFNFPIKIDAEKIIRMSGGANANGSCQIIGVLVHNSILNEIIAEFI
jgi:hypothetical protein